jgi:hypothetical protein
MSVGIRRLRRLVNHGPSPQARLSELQRASPPRYDPGGSLIRELTRRLPSDVGRLFRYRVVAAGEVGRDTVNACVEVLPQSEEYVIAIHSGAKRLIYTVARAVASATRIEHAGGNRIAASMTVDEAAKMLAGVFKLYAAFQAVQTPRHEITPEGEKLAHAWSVETELFLLAHEIAHVWAATMAVRGSETLLRGHSRHTEEESVCDRYAMRWLLNFAAMDGGASVRMIYAGCELMIRILRSLELCGVKFEDSHPGAQARLITLRHWGAEACGELGVKFDDVRSIAVAQSECLTAVERLLIRTRVPPISDPDCLRVRFIAVFEELEKGTISIDEAADEVAASLRHTNVDIVIGIVHGIYSRFSQEGRSSSASVVERVMALAPDPAPEAFARSRPGRPGQQATHAGGD